MAEFIYNMSSISPILKFETRQVFDTGYSHSDESAIDDFVSKRNSLFLLTSDYLANNQEVPIELGKLIFLGLISAVESYMRKVLRLLISTDKISEKQCENQVVKYGSVLSHKDTDLLAESLMENYSFSNGYNIKNTIESLLGIKCMKSKEEPFRSALVEYTKICELRHCIVHRFGLLGSHNAIKLGLESHLECVEKPVVLNYATLSEINVVCTNTVKAINNFLFCSVLERTFINKSIVWKLHYGQDRRNFIRYYNIFKDSQNGDDPKDIYKTFINALKSKYGSNYFVGL